MRNTQVTIATVYAPNDRQDTFLHRTLKLLSDFQEGQLILGGDFNTPLNPAVDTSSNTSSMRVSTLKRITKDLHNAQLIDIWRLTHSGERDYTFYSTPHKVYSRLDYFFIPHRQLEAIQAVEIVPLGQTTLLLPCDTAYRLIGTPDPDSGDLMKVYFKHQKS